LTWYAVIAARGDQMRPDQSVRAQSADEKAETQQPEVPGTHGPPECPHGDEDGIFRRGFVVAELSAGRRAIRRKPEIGRTIAHQQRDHGDQAEKHACHQDHERSPAKFVIDAGEYRQEQQLARCRTCGHQADHQAAALREPGVGDRRSENERGHSRSAADHEPPEQVELPGLRNERGQAHSGCRDGHREHHDLP
jgi:hypothetical protein